MDGLSRLASLIFWRLKLFDCGAAGRKAGVAYNAARNRENHSPKNPAILRKTRFNPLKTHSHYTLIVASQTTGAQYMYFFLNAQMRHSRLPSYKLVRLTDLNVSPSKFKLLII